MNIATVEQPAGQDGSEVRNDGQCCHGQKYPGPDSPRHAMQGIRDCRPVAFVYTDLSGNQTARTVLPLVLVHPPQGVKLLAWCQEREGFRQFFVRAIRGIAPRPGDFTADRLALLKGLLDKETARD